eukprot:869736-Amphidinium_carterae.1
MQLHRRPARSLVVEAPTGSKCMQHNGCPNVKPVTVTCGCHWNGVPGLQLRRGQQDYRVKIDTIM